MCAEQIGPVEEGECSEWPVRALKASSVKNLSGLMQREFE